MKILVTGTAGFVGAAVARRLLERGDEVIGIDNINDYYDVSLKHGRLAEAGIDYEQAEWGVPVQSTKYSGYRFIRMKLEDREGIHALLEREQFARVCHLAAQAGVRYSITNPYDYIDSNIVGFMNILEGVRRAGCEHLVYASSSSVYGLNADVPFSEHRGASHPMNIYAASKRANELMAHSYSQLYGIPTTGLRFFTVYGEWGRPDMAPFLFTDAILHDRPIKVFNNGDMLRDFTYIDDIVEGVLRVIDTAAQPNPQWNAAQPDPATSTAPYTIYNIGNSQPVRLMDFIAAIEQACGKQARKEYYPMQPGDVYQTNADTSKLEQAVGFRPNTPIATGVQRTVDWFRSFYNC